MTAKEYLSQMLWLDREINNGIEQLEELRVKAEGLSQTAPTGMPHGSGGGDKLAQRVVRIVELQEYVNDQTDRLIDLRMEITQQIDRMKNQKNRVVLQCRYLRCMKWADIERELHYEHSSMMKRHKTALKEFERLNPTIRNQKRDKRKNQNGYTFPH